MVEERTLRDELKEIRDIVSEAEDTKKRKAPRKFSLPFKARISNNRLKKGYVTVGVINENMTVDFTREPIIDGTIKLNDTFHAIEEFDIFNYKGRPFIFQPKSKINPYNPLLGNNQTYGQKYIMARMEGDRITSKKSIGWGVSIGVLIIVGIVIYALMTGGA